MPKTIAYPLAGALIFSSCSKPDAQAGDLDVAGLDPAYRARTTVGGDLALSLTVTDGDVDPETLDVLTTTVSVTGGSLTAVANN